MQNSLKFPEEISSLPPSCGVYIMKSKEGEVLYVGKAKSLRHRVSAYRNPKDPKTSALVDKVKYIEFIVASSEAEALLLENNLIKKHVPKYNVRLVDDENYPYIKITDDDYPRILKVYSIRGENGVYFGPFPHGRVVELSIRALRKIFPIRSCNLKLTPDKTYDPCLLYHIGLCNAPCSHKVSQKEYLAMVEALKKFLADGSCCVIRNLRKELEKAKNNMDFEKAIVYRDALRGLEGIAEKQRVVSNSGSSFEVITVQRTDELACVVVVSVREGRVVSSYPFVMSVEGAQTDEEIIRNFIITFPFHAKSEKVYVAKVPEDRSAIETFIKSRNGRKTRILSIRGEAPKKVLSLANDNARLHLRNYIERHTFLREESLLLSLKNKLNLGRIPVRIEGYDISNISGVSAVGSMVVFTKGRPDKKEYRKFRIKLTEGPNDYEMMFEVLSRRFLHEGEFSKSQPDLIVVDGGKGQLDVALKVRNLLGFESEIIAIAKRNEEIFTEYSANPITLSKESEELKLLQRVRDEAHRFAKSYFRVLHSKRLIEGG